MRISQGARAAALLDQYQPHWVWAVALVAVPLCLVLIGFLGVTTGSPVPLAAAALTPRIALALSIGGMAAAILRARKIPIQIAAIGLAITATGFLLLLWLT